MSHSTVRLRRQLGGAIGKYLLLLVFGILLVGFFYWKDSTGVVGGTVTFTAPPKDSIAFVHIDDKGLTNVQVVKADGTDLRNLTSDKSEKRSPGWAPDGKQLTYVAQSDLEGSPAFQVFIVGQDKPKQITRGTISKDFPQFRPDGKFIGYLAGGAVKIVKPNGDDTVQIYPPPSKGEGKAGEESDSQGADPLKKFPLGGYRWAPNGVGIAALEIMEGDNAMVVGASNWDKQKRGEKKPDAPLTVVEPEALITLPDLEGKTMRLSMGRAVQFDWMPDSKRVLASINSRAKNAILIFASDIEKVQPTPVVVSDAKVCLMENPVVSPDGSKVAFEMIKMSPAGDRLPVGIVVAPIESGKFITITLPEHVDKMKYIVKEGATRPRWSPDGTRLLYLLAGPKGRDVWVVNADGSSPVNLTKGSGDNFDAVWSPVK